jgi:hypothetical protein
MLAKPPLLLMYALQLHSMPQLVPANFQLYNCGLTLLAFHTMQPMQAALTLVVKAMISVWHLVIACLADQVFTVLCCWVAVHLFVFAGLYNS